MPEKEIQATPAPPDTKTWLEYSWKLQQDIPNRFEDAAKFLATIISLSLTIIITAIDKLKLILIHPIWLFVVLVFWLSSLIFAFLVLFPEKYRFHSQSVDSIKSVQAKIVQTKQRRFIISTVLYFIPLVLLTFLYLISIMEGKP
ncbi:MAG: hypothetical protein AB1422_06715 [bacterium]